MNHKRKNKKGHVRRKDFTGYGTPKGYRVGKTMELEEALEGRFTKYRTTNKCVHDYELEKTYKSRWLPWTLINYRCSKCGKKKYDTIKNTASDGVER